MDSSKTTAHKNGANFKSDGFKVVKESVSTEADEEKIIQRDVSKDKVFQIVVSKSTLGIESTEGMQNWQIEGILDDYFTENSVLLYYELETPNRINFTEYQKISKQQLNQLKTYKGDTHIYTNDEVSPIFEVEVAGDFQAELTEVKQDISEIKEEQIEQNTNIESLQTKLEKVEKEFNDYAIHGQESGEFIHLTDSAKSSCKIDIKGNVKQTVTEQSANTLDLTKLTIAEKANIEIDSISANEVTFHATNNTATNYYLRLKTTLKQGTYYLRKLYEMLEGIAVSGNNGSGVIFISKSDWSKEFVRLQSITEEGNFTLTEDTEVFITLMLAKVEDGKIRFYNLMLSNENTEYVPFVPDSPSLDYSAPIQTVKDSVKVTTCSANTLDLTKLTIAEKPNVEIDNISANEVTFHATNNTATSYYLRFKTVLKQGTYYLRKLYEMLKGTAVSGNNGSGVIFISKSDWSKELVRLYANSGQGSFTLTEDTEVFITLMLAKSENGKIKFYNLMLSNDDVDFVAHEENSVTVPIQQNVFTGFDKVNKKELHGLKKIILDETQNYTLLTTTENYLRFMLDLSKTSDLKNGFKVYCENLKVVKQTTSNSVNEEKMIERDISLDKQLQIVILKSRLTEPTAEGLKQYLATNNIVAYCEFEEATKLDLTQEQIEALEKLDEMQTYKNITNITTDSIAILDADYKKDLETLINQVSQAVVEGS